MSEVQCAVVFSAHEDAFIFVEISENATNEVKLFISRGKAQYLYRTFAISPRFLFIYFVHLGRIFGKKNIEVHQAFNWLYWEGGIAVYCYCFYQTKVEGDLESENKNTSRC